MPIAADRVKFVFRKAERDLLKLASHTQPESVHSFRTTTRRLQTLLVELMPERTRNQKTLLKMVDEIRRRAGKVRDLDVQISALRSLKTGQEPRRKTQLLQDLLELRAKHERKLRKSLTNGTIREIRKRLKRAAKRAAGEDGRDPLAVAREMIGRAGPKALDEASLHAFRILVKRARYAAEFATRTGESAQFVSQLKRLQDTIGSWHDWQTLTNSAAGRLGDIGQSSLVAALHNVTGGKLRNAVAALMASEAIPQAKKTFPRKPERLRRTGTRPGPAAAQPTNSAA